MLIWLPRTGTPSGVAEFPQNCLPFLPRKRIFTRPHGYSAKVFPVSQCRLNSSLSFGQRKYTSLTLKQEWAPTPDASTLLQAGMQKLWPVILDFLGKGTLWGIKHKYGLWVSENSSEHGWLINWLFWGVLYFIIAISNVLIKSKILNLQVNFPVFVFWREVPQLSIIDFRRVLWPQVVQELLALARTSVLIHLIL